MATTTRRKISGKDGSVTVNGSAFCVKSWSLTEEVDNIDVTDTCSGGYVEYVTTFKKGSGSFEAFLDLNNVPTVLPGDPIAFVLKTTSASGGVVFTFNGFFNSFTFTSDVAGAVSFNGAFITNGVITQSVNP